MEKAGIFIDAGYLDKILQNYLIPSIDLRKFASFLLESDQLVKVFYYFCMPYTDSPPLDEQKKRFDGKQRLILALKRWPLWERGKESSLSAQAVLSKSELT